MFLQSHLIWLRYYICSTTMLNLGEGLFGISVAFSQDFDLVTFKSDHVTDCRIGLVASQLGPEYCSLGHCINLEA